jgi:hypothetical protein
VRNNFDIYDLFLLVPSYFGWFYGFIVFNAILNTILVISWRSVLLMEETGVPGESHRPAASHIMLCTSAWVVVEPTTLVVIGTVCIGSCKSIYHAITATTAPPNYMECLSLGLKCNTVHCFECRSLFSGCSIVILFEVPIIRIKHHCWDAYIVFTFEYDTWT